MSWFLLTAIAPLTALRLAFLMRPYLLISLAAYSSATLAFRVSLSAIWLSWGLKGGGNGRLRRPDGHFFAIGVPTNKERERMPLGLRITQTDCAPCGGRETARPPYNGRLTLTACRSADGLNGHKHQLQVLPRAGRGILVS